MPFDFTVREAGVQTAIDAMQAEYRNLGNQLDQAKSADSALSSAWEGDVKVKFIELQQKMANARDELNQAFQKFITQTSTNLADTNSMESKLQGQLQ